MKRILTLLSVVLGLSCGSGVQDEAALEQAEVLFSAGRYSQALPIYEELCADTSRYDPALQFRLAETAVLASQSERNRGYRNRARAALQLLSTRPGENDSLSIGHLWRRLGWEMARDNDSLQAYAAFGRAIEIAPGLNQVFEEEWLLRGTYASQHLSSVTDVPDSIAGTPLADSMLAASAEGHIVELGRVSLVRTDLRAGVLTARVRLLQFVPAGRRISWVPSPSWTEWAAWILPGGSVEWRSFFIWRKGTSRKTTSTAPGRGSLRCGSPVSPGSEPRRHTEWGFWKSPRVIP